MNNTKHPIKKNSLFSFTFILRCYHIVSSSYCTWICIPGILWSFMQGTKYLEIHYTHYTHPWSHQAVSGDVLSQMAS